MKKNSLYKEIVGLSPYNANLMDFLLKKENRFLPPEEWKHKRIYFWGTIYRGPAGDYFVRYLYNFSSIELRWRWSHSTLGGAFMDICGPAIVPAH